MSDETRWPLPIWAAISSWAWPGIVSSTAYSAAVENSAKAFHANVERLRKLVMSLEESYMAGKRTGALEVCATYQVTGRAHFLPQDGLEKWREAASLASKWANRQEVAPLWTMAGSGGHAGEFITTTHNREAFSPAVDALVMSLLIGTWTAFEVLAGDLWEAAINHHPTGLARLAGTRTRIRPKKDSQSQKKVSADEKSILLRDIERVAKGKYDLSSLMGTLLRPRHNFTTLVGIREAYSVAFSDDLGSSTRGIDSILADDVFDALSLLRNLLVHKSGFADEEYVNGSKQVPSLPQLEKNGLFEPSRETIEKIVVPAIAKAKELIVSVDDWVKSPVT